MDLPISFVNRMKEYLNEEFDAFIKSYENAEIKGLRMNNKEAAPSDILGAVFDDVLWCENGYSYFDDDIHPGKHPYHECGAYYIQEPSAMAPVTYLDIEPNDRVLDLCASPGGKSTQIGALLNGTGILVSNEIMPDRAKVLSENIERMGIGNALVISEDPRNISTRFEGFFDKILVDAPCSGEGMFRRSEVAVKEWSEENVKLCADRQAWILDEAAKMLREGGTLVYSTCTFSKEEDEEQIKIFLTRHSEFTLSEMEVCGGMKPGFEGIGVRLWPHLVRGEGHYVCKLVKNGTLGQTQQLNGTHEQTQTTVSRNAKSEHFADCSVKPCLASLMLTKRPPVYGYEPDLSKKDRDGLKEMFDFFNKNIKDKGFLEGRRLTKFKDQIYMLPKECPSLKGMKVLRPGLHLGTILKNRFEPAHALARILRADDVENACELSVNDLEVIKYFNGETFNKDKENGWYIIFVDGFSMGWGKITNGIVKNHYPKGLRKSLSVNCKG